MKENSAIERIRSLQPKEKSWWKASKVKGTTVERLAGCEALIEKGMSRKEVAASCGVSYNTLRRYLLQLEEWKSSIREGDKAKKEFIQEGLVDVNVVQEEPVVTIGDFTGTPKALMDTTIGDTKIAVEYARSQGMKVELMEETPDQAELCTPATWREPEQLGICDRCGEKFVRQNAGVATCAYCESGKGRPPANLSYYITLPEYATALERLVEFLQDKIRTEDAKLTMWEWESYQSMVDQIKDLKTKAGV